MQYARKRALKKLKPTIVDCSAVGKGDARGLIKAASTSGIELAAIPTYGDPPAGSNISVLAFSDNLSMHYPYKTDYKVSKSGP